MPFYLAAGRCKRSFTCFRYFKVLTVQVIEGHIFFMWLKSNRLSEKAHRISHEDNLGSYVTFVYVGGK